ncbi:protein sarah [Odontomachus brunneus]|uniref:protein sarah n=1 Tax=Odontomachus brunneus TaxID=486640 RepID=UPI0013F2676B|nr:protein sarah [Odontomachus brunneus]XP_032673285.1 protein sarah [Odontomachus brunneus]XP_032673286.1 protein sarah [Odontomachus brunneus]XP_032673287.1 protein sarah [Odontomachus brunneus]XP_032673288.1 protein sarah [Odontomachus brunneus]XP_032673289.1 protein sarah [Odontomachus brunneus]
MEEKRGTGVVEEEEPEDTENIIINEVDGLPNLHPNFEQLELEFDRERHIGDTSIRSIDELVHDEDLPTSVIVTNVDPRVFKGDELKPAIENLFKQFGEDATFQYFRSFRRMRVNYNSPSAAANARLQLHQTHFGETDINCYFAQPVTPIDMEDQHLQPPALTKQFLISPPASPPVGWEPREEGEPLVNQDLLAAIANLSAGGSHELHPPGSGQPGIVVHVCENANPAKNAPRIQHTRCPEH